CSSDLSSTFRGSGRLAGGRRSRSCGPPSVEVGPPPELLHVAPGVTTGTELSTQRLEGAEARLPLALDADDAGLPAGQPSLVANQEPDEHVDPVRTPRDRDGLVDVARLVCVPDAEEAVRRARLVAVLGDPEALAAVEAVGWFFLHPVVAGSEGLF